jgi:hypothetical protein
LTTELYIENKKGFATEYAAKMNDFLVQKPKKAEKKK